MSATALPTPACAAGFAVTYVLPRFEPDPNRCMTEVAALPERVGEPIPNGWLADG